MMGRIIQDLESYKKIFDKVVEVQEAFFNYYSIKKLFDNHSPEWSAEAVEDFEKRVCNYRVAHEKVAFELNLLITHLSDSEIPPGSILRMDFDEPFFKAIKKMFDDGKDFDRAIRP